MSYEQGIGVVAQIANALGQGILILARPLLGRRLDVTQKDMLARASGTEEVAPAAISLRHQKCQYLVCRCGFIMKLTHGADPTQLLKLAHLEIACHSFRYTICTQAHIAQGQHPSYRCCARYSGNPDMYK